MITKEQMAQMYIPCTCGHPYTSRNLIAPDCAYHNHDIEILMDKWADTKSQEVAIEYHEWVMDNVMASGRDEVGHWHLLNGNPGTPLSSKELFLKYKQSKEQ